MTKKHILITGGAGFIGSNLAAYHLQKGDDVWVVDNLQTGQLQNIEPFRINPQFKFDKADVVTWPKLQEAVKWADWIYHMAACVGQRFVLANPVTTISSNIRACELILEAMDKANNKSRLIIASTSGVYRNSNLHPQNGYGEDSEITFPSGEFLQETYPVSKFVNEIMCLSYLNEKGVDCIIARLFNTIGPNQTGVYGMVVPTFIKQALANQPLTVFGDGQQTRSFCNVHDTINAMTLLMDNPKTKGQIVNIGNDRECSILELAKLVINRTKSKSDIRFVPYLEAYGVNFNDVKVRRPDLKKLKAITGFSPNWTLEQSIDEIVNSLKKQLSGSVR